MSSGLPGFDDLGRNTKLGGEPGDRRAMQALNVGVFSGINKQSRSNAPCCALPRNSTHPSIPAPSVAQLVSEDRTCGPLCHPRL